MVGFGQQTSTEVILKTNTLLLYLVDFSGTHTLVKLIFFSDDFLTAPLGDGSNVEVKFLILRDATINFWFTFTHHICTQIDVLYSPSIGKKCFLFLYFKVFKRYKFFSKLTTLNLLLSLLLLDVVLFVVVQFNKKGDHILEGCHLVSALWLVFSGWLLAKKVIC